MKINKLALFLFLFLALFCACNKNHYDTSHLQGVAAEGVALFPLTEDSFTLMEMMQRFHVDSLLDFDASGNMSYNYHYEHLGVVKGSELLRFKDLNYAAHYEFENPFPQMLPEPVDTVVRYDHTLTFEAEHISVVEAIMRSGRFDFDMSTNIGLVQRVVVRSADIHDAQGHELELDFAIGSGSFGFDLAGLHYETNVPNTLNISYELYCSVQGTVDPELYFDIDITGSDLAIQEMRGYVERYGSRNAVDTVFHFFPENMTGVLRLNDVDVRLRERNTFSLEARLEIDTATIFGDGIMPYPLFNPLPLAVDMPSQMGFNEVFSQSVNGEINAQSGRAYASSNFIINPNGMTEQVSVADTCEIDIRVDVDIPLAFRVNDVRYADTLAMKIYDIDSPEWIKKATLELTLTSTIPFELSGDCMLYDTLTGRVTDVLLDQATLLAASYNGQPSSTTIAIEMTGERLQHLLQSNGLVVDFALNTDGHDVRLNANQSIGVFAKAQVEYDGVINIKKD